MYIKLFNKITVIVSSLLCRFSIKKPAEMKKFIVDMTAKACFNSRCVPNTKIFDGTEIPQPICDMNANFNLEGIQY
jgi:hypothetical protein